MADKITDEELVEELKGYGEVVKVPIDKKKRPILIKKLNHFRARGRLANQAKKTTPSRSRHTKNVEFSSAEESEEEESVGPVKRLLGKQGAQRDPVTSYSKTDTIEISPPRTRAGSRRSSRQSGVGTNSGDTAGPSPRAAKSLYPDLSREVGGAARNSSMNYSYDNQNEFTDSDIEESIYVENKSVNTTFTLRDSFVEDQESPVNRSIKQRKPINRGKSSKKENNASWTVYSSPGANSITENKEEDEQDSPSDRAYEPPASVISTSILCLVICFFLVVGTTYIYLRQDSTSPESAEGKKFISLKQRSYLYTGIIYFLPHVIW
jgi:hypothetical protein